MSFYKTKKDYLTTGVDIIKSNIHKKITNEDKFARKYYCDKARIKQLRLDKRVQKKKFRQSKFMNDHKKYIDK